MKRPAKVMIWVFGVLLFVVVVVVVSAMVFFCGPGGSGILAEQELPDGRRCVVTQEWAGWDSWSEPYSVGFRYEVGDGTWAWCYLGHEEGRWWDTRMELDEGSGEVVVYHGREVRARFDLESGDFGLEIPFKRVVSAPHGLDGDPYVMYGEPGP